MHRVFTITHIFRKLIGVRFSVQLQRLHMKNRFIKQLLVILGWIILCGISIYFYQLDVVPYFTGDIEPRKAAEKSWLIVHYSGAFCTLFLGPLQFWGWFRNRHWKWHRLAGKFYIGGSIVSACMVFYLLTNYPIVGSIPSLSFLAVIWLFTTITAFWFATKRNIKMHKQFMIRSYVCGLAFVFIRVLPYVNNFTGIFNFLKTEEMQRTVYEWMCWVYPLMITEFVLSWWPAISKMRSLKPKKIQPGSGAETKQALQDLGIKSPGN